MQHDLLKDISQGYFEVYFQENVPLFQNIVYNSELFAKNASKGSVQLIQSKITGFIYNKTFNSSLLIYDKNYQNEQSNSSEFKNHLLEVVDILLKFGGSNKKVVEIGCGKASFFNLLQKKGVSCTGFDPAYEGDDASIIKDYFSSKYSIVADIIILRHTLEHIENPYLFIKQIAEANNNKGYIFIEVPSFDWIVNKKAFWDIFYEHCNYFTPHSLSNIFNKSIIGEFFGKQYLYCYAKLADIKDSMLNNNSTVQNKISFISTLDRWKIFLKSNTNIIIWGAGAKGSTFLNILDPEKKHIIAAIDINPEKQNKFIAVTGHPIYAPEKLHELKVENIIIMNEIYEKEIKNLLNKMNLVNINLICL